MVSYILPTVLMVGAFMLLMNFITKKSGGMGGIGGIGNVGKANAKVYMEKSTGVTFADVAGRTRPKRSLCRIIDFLHNPERYTAIGAKIPKGALLVGSPGTGKTLLAKAVAGEAKVPFFSISGSDFVEMFVGVGASRVRDLFAEASKVAPCIIFIDEIDTIGKSRDGGRYGGGNDEREQTLNQLLAEMDGFDPSKGVIVLAATNRPEVLDKALLRPGRFDRRITVDRPNLAGPLSNAAGPHARHQARRGRGSQEGRARDRGLRGRGPCKPRQRGGAPRRAGPALVTHLGGHARGVRVRHRGQREERQRHEV